MIAEQTHGSAITPFLDEVAIDQNDDTNPLIGIVDEALALGALVQVTADRRTTAFVHANLSTAERAHYCVGTVVGLHPFSEGTVGFVGHNAVPHERCQRRTRRRQSLNWTRNQWIIASPPQ
jgi:hypothetical protein